MTCRRDNRYVPGMRNFPFVRRFLRGDAATTSTAAPAPTRDRKLSPTQPLLLPVFDRSKFHLSTRLATLISRSRGQGGLLRGWRTLGGGGGFFIGDDSRNIGCTRGESLDENREESMKRRFSSSSLS